MLTCGLFAAVHLLVTIKSPRNTEPVAQMTMLPFLSVRSSVCPLPVLCLNECTYRHCFSTLPSLPNFNGNPLSGALKRGVRIICDFRQETVRDRPMVTYCRSVVGSHSYRSIRIGFIDLERQSRVSP